MRYVVRPASKHSAIRRRGDVAGWPLRLITAYRLNQAFSAVRSCASQ
ncbi:hypothetical protein KCP73_08360 [Salmonella enterica subsp. enterica]|nr:hypothetical protein KCP73_08360 [Salmonella enterica subsp. enterica]